MTTMPDLKVHHGGYFVESLTIYLSGNVKYVRNVDPDLMSFFKMLDFVKEC